MFILSKECSDNINKFYIKSIKNNEIENDVSYELVNVQKDHKNTKIKIIFSKLRLVIFSNNNNNIISNTNIRFIIQR